MKNRSVLFSVLAFSIVVALVCGVFLTASVTSASKDAAEGTFRVDKTFSFKVVSWMYVGCLAAFLVFTFLFKKRFSRGMAFGSGSYKAASVIGILVSIFLAIYGLVCQVKAVKAPGSSDVLLDSPSGSAKFYFPNVLFIAFLFGTAVYFYLCYAGRKEKRNDGFAALSLTLPAAIVVKLVCDYLAQNTNGHSSLYNFHILALSFSLLFAVNETRVYLRKSAPALYIFFGLSAASASLLYAVPSLLLHYNGVSPLGGRTDLIYCFIDILMAVYAYIKMFSLGVKEGKPQDDDYDEAVVISGNA